MSILLIISVDYSVVTHSIADCLLFRMETSDAPMLNPQAFEDLTATLGQSLLSHGESSGVQVDTVSDTESSVSDLRSEDLETTPDQSLAASESSSVSNIACNILNWRSKQSPSGVSDSNYFLRFHILPSLFSTSDHPHTYRFFTS